MLIILYTLVLIVAINNRTAIVVVVKNYTKINKVSLFNTMYYVENIEKAERRFRGSTYDAKIKGISINACADYQNNRIYAWCPASLAYNKKVKY